MDVQPSSFDLRPQTSLVDVLAGLAGANAAAPIRAGMRARAIVDACERSAVPAVFLDRAGRILHVAAAAKTLMSDRLSIVADHLVGDGPALNRAVEQAVGVAVGDETQVDVPKEMVSCGAETLTVVGVRYRDPCDFQLLAGVLILGSCNQRVSEHVASLRRALAA